MTPSTENDYKQYIYKLETDFDFELWQQAEKDYKFLIEIKERLVKGEKDSSQKEYAFNMINDWILELKEKIDK